MKKKYKIHIKTISITDNEENIIEIFEPCKFIYNEEKQSIIYNEPSENEMENVKTVFSIFNDEKIVIERTGTIEHKIKIEKDKIIVCHYTTIHGVFVMSVQHIDIKNNLCSDGGELFIHYVIMVEDNVLSENRVYIQIV